MVLHVLRALFVLLMAAIGWFYLGNPQAAGINTWLVVPVTLSIGVLFVCIDIVSPRRKLAVFSGTILGLMVGLAIAFALSFVVRLLIDEIGFDRQLPAVRHDLLIGFVNILVGTVCCYLSISFILQTRDDFRFIIPYVEFSRQQKGPRPLVLDTSALIDGRIADIAATGIIENQLIVPRFVVDELQGVADSAEKLKRARGRRGLDVLSRLKSATNLDVRLYDASHLSDLEGGVDAKIVHLARELTARIATTDYNLNKVAQLSSVEVLFLPDLAAAMKPPVMAGERMAVKITRPGDEAGQGVGYLPDGTMVVVEQARSRVNDDVEIIVSRVLQTSAGRMVFGRLLDDAAPPAPAPRPGVADPRAASADSRQRAV